MMNKTRSTIGALALMATSAFGGTNDVSNVASIDYQVLAAPAVTNAPFLFTPELTSSGVVLRAKGFTPDVSYMFQSKNALSDSSWTRVGTYVTQQTNENQVIEKLVPVKTKAFYRCVTK